MHFKQELGFQEVEIDANTSQSFFLAQHRPLGLTVTEKNDYMPCTTPGWCTHECHNLSVEYCTHLTLSGCRRGHRAAFTQKDKQCALMLMPSKLTTRDLFIFYYYHFRH